MKRHTPADTAQHSDAPPRALDTPTALIAEDEPLIAAALERELAAVWPELRIVATASNGREAIERIGALEPDVAFLDISMPGATGLDVARACANLAAPPQIVFVTAYDAYALEAFEAAAIDYLLKPVETARLARTVERLRARLARPAANDGEAPQMQPDLQRVLRQLEAITQDVREARAGARSVNADGAPRETPLRYLRASSGNDIRMVPVEDVLYFEAADKYVVVTTRSGELLIRTSLRELCAQLDPARFWQVHRGTVVNVDQVECASVSAIGKMTLKLRGHAGALDVSRQYAHLFKQM
ncbi:LytTR family DNA-binding domain-containing protein [Paraburkholderia sp. CNPSo 3274]|uniref:LytR/AlgR family response regulator transcription factor n=1 Tax=Paraburkholderia sp. CNPSo 3274 TaxID=2940932 RepID=UPI0020B64158|nr:LytTR family DNA-binding domain-containing protein [Paraburkholderia sp. CNPSo 3274]MCP3713122.1 LytTR family DNA-binding domain-containing protein [Paraburkholderia sp. CNPSo 3274]